MGKLNSIIISVGFVTIIGSVSLISIFKKDTVFSENENRFLMEKPDFTLQNIFSGKFGDDYETYLTDQFIGRNQWIGIKTITEMLIGKNDINSVYLADDNYLIDMNNDVDEEKGKQNADRLSEFVKTYSRLLGENSVKVMLVPTASSILTDKLPANAQTFNQTDFIQYVYNEIGQNNAINVNGVLSEHADEYIYYRTDHHWTSLGAYYAFFTWCSEQNIEIDEKDYIKECVADDFAGTVYSKIHYAKKLDEIYVYNRENSSDFKVYYEDLETFENGLYEYDRLDTKDKYSFFLDGNHSIVRIESGNNNGKKLLVIKDSYAHCFVPLIADQYEEIVMIDLRYYKDSISRLTAEEEITDVLVLYNAINFIDDNNFLLLSR